MNGMRVVCGIDQRPDFRRSQHRLFRNPHLPVGSIQKQHDWIARLVDILVEGQQTRLHSLRFRDLRDWPQGSGQRTCLGDLLRGNSELHDNKSVALENQLRTPMLAEVDDKIGTLTRRDFEIRERNWRGSQTLVSADLMKWHRIARPILDER